MPVRLTPKQARRLLGKDVGKASPERHATPEKKREPPAQPCVSCGERGCTLEIGLLDGKPVELWFCNHSCLDEWRKLHAHFD